MIRQNSFPTPLAPRSARVNSGKHRRQSHDVNVGFDKMPRKVSQGIVFQMYQAEIKNAELDKRKASAAFRSLYDPSVNVNTTFTFGYASVAHNFRRTKRDSIASVKSDGNRQQPSTSSADDEGNVF